MKAILFVLAAGASFVIAVKPVSAQSMSVKCTSLVADYEQIEKAMASRWSDGLGDNDAPRATLRAMEDANGIARAQILITLIPLYRCPLPDHAPSFKRYSSAALACRAARLKGGTDVPECKMETWQPR